MFFLGFIVSSVSQSYSCLKGVYNIFILVNCTLIFTQEYLCPFITGWKQSFTIYDVDPFILQDRPRVHGVSSWSTQSRTCIDYILDFVISFFLGTQSERHNVYNTIVLYLNLDDSLFDPGQLLSSFYLFVYVFCIRVSILVRNRWIEFFYVTLCYLTTTVIMC